MHHQRRTLLQAGLAVGTVALAVGAGLLAPRAVLAAWPKTAFEARKLPDALNALLGNSQPADSRQITIKAPDIAENGAVVSVTVTANLPAVESISVFVPVNTFPLAASYELSDVTDGFVTGRIKMAKTSDVIAVVKAGGRLYTSRKGVKVTLGGCGG